MEFLALVLAGLQIDFRFAPRITLENAGTQSIEYRRFVRKMNGQEKIWMGKYTHKDSPSKSIASLLIKLLEEIEKLLK